jgi:putative Holliday junction resolvase
MAIINLENLKSTTGPLLGVDPGTKTLGLAISDGTRLIASPLETIRRTKFTQDAARLLSIYDDNSAQALVVGLPVNMDGSHGPRVQSVKDFCANLLKIRDLPIFLWDERLSTMAVTRTMLEGDLSRKKRAQNVDKLAAAYILQGVLDRLKAA